MIGSVPCLGFSFGAIRIEGGNMADPKYSVNVNTKKLHLTGGCGYSGNQNCRTFYTVEEVKAEFGDKVTACQYCILKYPELKELLK